MAAVLQGGLRSYLLVESDKLRRGETCLFDDCVEGTFRYRFGKVDGNSQRPVVTGAVHSEMAALLPSSSETCFLQDSDDLRGAQYGKFLSHAKGSPESGW